MMKKSLYIITILIFLLAALQFKSKETSHTNATINLKWYKAYPTETWSVVEKGMLWSFYYLGALLPKNSIDSALTFKDSATFSINFHKLGFTDQACAALSIICDSIKNTEDYKYNKAIDLSRFLVLTLYSSYNYYSITGAEPVYKNFMEHYQLSNPIVFGVTKSSVSDGHRLIKFSKDTTSIFNIGFVAEEGSGSLFDGTFKTEFFETFDIMSNGQFRFAIYNSKGELIDAVSSKHSIAGKPGKCMWCHETSIPVLFTTNTSVKNMLSNTEFEQTINSLQIKLNSFRNNLSTDMNFEKQHEHTTSELLYISFMEPSLYRLRNEFGKDTVSLKAIEALPMHDYEEFPFLGNLYWRQKSDNYFHYAKIQVPEFVREKSKYEPSYINKN